MIYGSDDEAAVLQALTDDAPSSITVEGFTWYRSTRSVEQVGPLLWEGEVEYAPATQDPVENESRYTFETGGGTQHITQSLQTIASYALPAETAPDFSGAIGVGRDSIEGVDIIKPDFSFSETHWKSDAFVTDAYKQTLFDLTGRVNGDTFKGFEAGEVLFLGASGSRTGADLWELTFNFRASKNETALTIGGITIAAKKGWEYLWFRYREKEDAAAKMIVREPLAAYVEQVYEEGNFASIGI